MVPPDQAIQSGINLHRQGNLAAAEQVYRSVLAAQPNHFEALHLLGVLRVQQNRPAEALPLFEQALAINPHATDALANSATALMAVGRPVDALARLEALQ